MATSNMKKLLLSAIAVLLGLITYSQINMSQVGYLDLRTMHNSDLNDIWGYTDENGNEYAIVGLNNGTSVVDISDPANPVEISYFPGMNSIWRDMKVWGDYAYITTEANQGLEIIDLSPLPGSTALTSSYYFGPSGSEWQSAHNIYVDAGYAYIFGANRGNGGVIILDVNTTPGAPIEIGVFDEWYCHDGFVQNDTGYFSHINDGFFSIVDLDDKANVQLTDVIGSLSTSSVFTHNCWASANGQVLYTTDEKENGFIDSYDISDPANPLQLDVIQSSPGNDIIPHNTHVKGNLLITSYYTDGVVVHDISDPSNMVEVANFDTSPGYNGNTFNGCWGVYPFFASDNLIASDIEKGLYVLSIASTLSAYLQGTVTNAGNGQPINNAQIEILGTAITDNAGVLGGYSIGNSSAGNYDVRYSAPGFYDDTLNVDFITGQVTTEDVALVQVPLFTTTITVIDGNTSLGVENAMVRIDHTQQSFEGLTDANGEVTFDLFYEDNYDITAGKWLYTTACISPQMITVANNSIEIEIFEGIYDDFSFDYGWTASGTADAGDWVRKVPVGTTGGGENPNPFFDDNDDCSKLAYLTGNGASSVGGDDVDGGYVELQSPIFDVTAYFSPGIKLSYWFYNGFGSGTPNDDYEILISNGTDEVQLALYEENTAVISTWTEETFKISDFLIPTATMKLKLIATDNPSGHVMKAGIDHFRVEELSTVDLEEETANSISIYPNPAAGILNVNGITKGSYELMDLSGRMVQKGTLASTIKLTAVSNGLYVIVIKDEFGTILKTQKQRIE
jgi:choice-of-anchor B domain-containing protein